MFLLATAFQDTIWMIAFIFFSISIFTWSKNKVTNGTIALLITILIVYLLFFRFPRLVWFLAIVMVIYWIYGSDVKKFFKSDLLKGK